MSNGIRAYVQLVMKLGFNLGFIEAIQLTDGTIIENMQVLKQAPIPSKEQLREIFSAANDKSIALLGPATKEWSNHRFRPPQSAERGRS